MSSPSVTHQEVKSKLDELSPDELPKVLDYIEFLMHKHQESSEPASQIAEQETPYRVVAKLEGVLKDHPITEEDTRGLVQVIW
jgi:hypothetical protein